MPTAGSSTSAVHGAVSGAGIRSISVLAWRDLAHPAAGGSERYVSEVLRRWSDAGVEVKLRTRRVDGQPDRVSRDGYAVVRRGGALTSIPRTVAHARARRRRSSEGIVEVWHGINFVTPLWARGPRIAVVPHVAHEAQHVLGPRAAVAAEVFERWMCPRLYASTPIVTFSESGRDELTGLGYDRSCITVVPPGLGPQFTPGGRRHADPLVLSVGRLVPQKRVDLAIDAVAALRDRHPTIRLLVVGTGRERPGLEGRARAIGAPVTFTGHVSERTLVSLYRSAWALISASVSEGWNMTISEAGGCGTPSVVSDIPGHRDATGGGRGGVLARNTRELVDGLDRLLADHTHRASLARGARALAAGLDWDRTATGLLRVLASTCTGGSRRGGMPRR